MFLFTIVIKQYFLKTIQYHCLILWGLNFRGFLSMVIYEALYVTGPAKIDHVSANYTELYVC